MIHICYLCTRGVISPSVNVFRRKKETNQRNEFCDVIHIYLATLRTVPMLCLEMSDHTYDERRILVEKVPDHHEIGCLILEVLAPDLAIRVTDLRSQSA